MHHFDDFDSVSCADVSDKLVKSNEDFVWTIEYSLTGKLIIDVEFLDLKIASSSEVRYDFFPRTWIWLIIAYTR